MIPQMGSERIGNLRSKIAILAVQNPKNTQKHGFGECTIRTYVNYERAFEVIVASQTMMETSIPRIVPGDGL